MIWLNLSALVGLVAIGVPVIIHLLGRRRAKPEKFPSLRFLQTSQLLPTRRTEITDVPLLIVRGLILAAAVAALARPLLLTRQRSADFGRAVARAIVIDSSASTGRLAAAGAGQRVVEVARATARQLAAAATSSVVIETGSVAHAIPGALAWLHSQPGRPELTVLSDFQAGAVDSATIAGVPPEVGITLTAIAARPDTAPPTLAARKGALATTTRVMLTPDRTAAEWTTTRIAAVDSLTRAPILLAGPTEQADADAALHAAMGTGGPWHSSTNAPVAIVFPESDQRPRLIREAAPLDEPWMADAVARVRDDATLAAAATQAFALAADVQLPAPNTSNTLAPFLVVAQTTAGRPVAMAARATVDGHRTLVFFAMTNAGTLAAAALIDAAGRATGMPSRVSELDPTVTTADQLRRWERPAPTTAVPRLGEGATDSDGRWLWVVALILLGLETWMRRERRHATGQQPALVAHERAA